MKKLIIYFAALAIGGSFLSCSEEKLDPESVIVPRIAEMNDFDNYLYREYIVPYNVEIKYRLDAREISGTDQLVGAPVASSKIMSVLLKHLWLDAYSEVTGSAEFIKLQATRTIQFVGSGRYDTDGSVTLGTAEGGKKIVLYKLIDYLQPKALEPANLLSISGTFHVIHHEFTHIFQQTKNYSPAYKEITPDAYVGDQWINQSIENALNKGCITPYGMFNYDEDFAEMFSTYVTFTEQQWQDRVSQGSAEGQAAIAEKIAMIDDYMWTAWRIHLDDLRDVILRRAYEVNDLEFVDLR